MSLQVYFIAVSRQSIYCLSGDSKIIEGFGLLFLHDSSFFRSHMVVSEKMKHAVCKQEAELALNAVTVFLCLGINSVYGDHHISKK